MTGAPGVQDIEELLRELAPEVLGALVRRYGRFGACEDAVQEAMLDALTSWPVREVPDSPKGWLLTVASRRLIDEVRSEHARRRHLDIQCASGRFRNDAGPAGLHHRSWRGRVRLDHGRRAANGGVWSR